MPKLQIDIEADNQASDELSEVQKDIRGVGEENEKVGTANKKAGLSFTELNSAVSLVKQGYQLAQQAIAATVGPTVELATQQRDLALASGTSAEEAGVMIQVADDLGVSYDSLKTGFKKLNAEGIQPNLENIIALSEEYQRQPGSVEKAQFAAEKLGRAAGPEMQKLLQLSRAELQAMSDAALASGNVLSNEAVAGARAYEIAMDDLSDAGNALAMGVGQDLIPLLTQLADFTVANVVPAVGQFADMMREGMAAGETLGDTLALLKIKYDLETGAIDQATASAQAWLIANEGNIASTGEATVALDGGEMAQEAARAATETATVTTEENTSTIGLNKIAQDAVSASMSTLKSNMAGAVGNEMEQIGRAHV